MNNVFGNLWNEVIDASDISSDDEWMQDDIWDDLYDEEITCE